MADVVYVRRLTAHDARAAAKVERQVYAEGQRQGRAAISMTLQQADATNTNLSLGLFRGNTLLGYVLAIVRERRRIFDDFQVHHARAAHLKGDTAFVEDVVITASASKFASLLLRKWLRELRWHHGELPMDAFCTEKLLKRWSKYGRGFRLAGLVASDPLPVRDINGREQWFWLSWARDPGRPQDDDESKPGARINAPLPTGFEARLVRGEADWLRLEADWTQLHQVMPRATFFGSFQFLFTWWKYYGLPYQLFIVTLYENGRIVAIAPLMIAPKRIFGPYRRRLEFMGDDALMERPTFVLSQDHPEAAHVLMRAVIATSDHWDAAYFREQELADGQQHPAHTSLADTKFHASESETVLAPHVDLAGTWQDYLTGRSKQLRRNIRNKRNRLERLGSVELSGYADNSDASDSLGKYLEIEKRSWKSGKKFGVADDIDRLNFYRELFANIDSVGEVHFRFLMLDDRRIAGTFGFAFNGNYSSVEICHAAEFDYYSPGLVLTALELEECHNSRSYSDFDFLSGMLNNKTIWATGTRESRHIYVLPKNFWGYGNAYVMFSLKPFVKRILARWKLDQFALDTLDWIRDHLP